jgi:uncharacterized membrane protein YuzA (DUF378 family)
MGSKRFFMIAMVLLVLGGLNWGYAAFYGRDFVSKVAGKKAWIVYGLVGLAALLIGFSRDTYLPFLGPTVMPCSLLQDQIPEGADTSVTLQTHPGAKVLYWATEPATQALGEIKDWRQAYLKFGNAGVVTADTQGVAVLSVRKPQPYTVPMKGRLESHIHYRICGDNGMLGRVETTYLPKEESFEPNVTNNEQMYDVNYKGVYKVSQNAMDSPSGERYLMNKNVNYEYAIHPSDSGPQSVVTRQRIYQPSFSSSKTPTTSVNFLLETNPDQKKEREIQVESSVATPYPLHGSSSHLIHDSRGTNTGTSSTFYTLSSLMAPASEETPKAVESKEPKNYIFFDLKESFETENQKEIDSIEHIKTETMARINQMDTNGIDESPQPAGAPYQTAFYLQQ